MTEASEVTFGCRCGCNITLTCDDCGCEMGVDELAEANQAAEAHVCKPAESP